MCRERIISLLPIPIIIFVCFLMISSIHAKDGPLHSQLLDYAGKTYTETQDPSFQNYDLALREYIADRISKRFGITLDPKIYSGFDLLEIEALFKCKKKEEPFDLFLNNFPKHP